MSRLARTLTDANARLAEAISRVDAAHQAMTDRKPGYPSGTIGTRGSGSEETQPERLHASLRNDPAVRAIADLERDVRVIAAAADRLYGLVTEWGTRRVRMDDETGDRSLWCVSCLRDAGYCEPTAEGVYKELCRWCGDWRAEHDGDDPPVVLLRRRHEGRRITTADVERALRSA